MRYLVLLALLAFVPKVQAQVPDRPKLLTMVDTVNVAGVAPNVYSTWIYAVATPKSWPSSAILVAFDCQQRKVQRLAHIVYKMRADSSGVEGPIVPDEGTWVDVSVPRTFDLVCRIGAQRPYTPSETIKPEADTVPPAIIPVPRS